MRHSAHCLHVAQLVEENASEFLQSPSDSLLATEVIVHTQSMPSLLI